MDLKLRDPNFILNFLDMQCSNKGGVLISKKIMWHACMEKKKKRLKVTLSCHVSCVCE